MAQDNTSPEQQAKINSLLEEERDTMGDIISLHEKINTGLFKRIQMQGQYEKLIEKSNVELLNAKKFAEGKTGTEKTEADLIVRSIQQRLLGYNKELDLLKIMNLSAIAPMLFLWKSIWSLFEKMDKSVVEFNMHMGLMRKDSAYIQKSAQNIAIQFMDIGVTIDKVYKSWQALGEVMGSIYIVDKELVKTVSILSAQLGVAEETTAGFLRNMAAISGTTLLSQNNTAYIAANLSKAAGTNLNKVMADVASKSENTLNMISRVPAIVIKSAVEFRRLGTSLDEVANSSRHILSFTENIQEEMEASVLLGHSINLQKARELAYHNDLIGANREILNLAKQNNFLTKMDVFQREAFAKATGKSVSELTSMVQAEQEWNDKKRNGTDAVKSQISEYERLKSLNEKSLGDESAKFALMVQQKSNQERLVAITQKWNQIVAQLEEHFLPILDATLSLVPPLIQIGAFVFNIAAGWFTVAKSLIYVGSYLEDIVSGVKSISKVGTVLATVGETIMVPFLKLSEFFGSIITRIVPFLRLFSTLSKFAAVLDFIPGLGEIVIAIQAIWAAGKGVFEIFGLIKEGKFGEAISAGILLPFKILKAVLIQPFIDMWNWFTNSPLHGNSPSEMGLAILRGLLSVQSMVFDALTYPFRHAFAWILDHIPGMSKISLGLRAGFGGVNSTIDHKINPVSDITSVQNKPIEKLSNSIDDAKSDSKEDKTQNETGNTLLQGILKAINDLNENLKAGNIAVNLDGSLVSTRLARSIEFKGNYGVN